MSEEKCSKCGKIAKNGFPEGYCYNCMRCYECLDDKCIYAIKDINEGEKHGN